jgi:hypothetical protein
LVTIFNRVLAREQFGLTFSDTARQAWAHTWCAALRISIAAGSDLKDKQVILEDSMVVYTGWWI